MYKCYEVYVGLMWFGNYEIVFSFLYLYFYIFFVDGLNVLNLKKNFYYREIVEFKFMCCIILFLVEIVGKFLFICIFEDFLINFGFFYVLIIDF